MIKVATKIAEDSSLPRIGGKAFIKKENWPKGLNDVPLSLLFSIPLEATQLIQKTEEQLFVSVFTTYTDEYFLDDIVDNGDLQETIPVWTAGTRVVIHPKEKYPCSLGKMIPSYEFLLPAMDTMGEIIPAYLQAEPQLPQPNTFLFQFTLDFFPLELQDILFISDAVGYVFLNLPQRSGVFFAQCT